MAFEQREGSGALFQNYKKEKGSKQPDYRGDAMFEGKMVEISGWTKPTSKGGEFISLMIKEKQAYTPKQETKPSDPAFANMDDDIPF